jgi:DNA-binding SARP family transcriptional activator
VELDWGISLTDAGEAGIRVQLLGPVRAWRGDDELELGGPQRRALLGMLASRRYVISRGELIDGLWGQGAPASAENSVHVHISALRRVLEPRRASRAPGRLLAATGPGYRLTLAPGTLDTDVLDGHMAAARQLATGDPRAAVRSLDAALSLWQGAALAGAPGPWADIERARLEELRQATTADRIDILLRLGGHHEVLAELAALTRQHPLRERFWGQLMLALYRCGRQGEALAAFADARRELAGQLGVDPGPALRRLHEQVLAADPALEESRPAQPERTPGYPLYAPRLLPADVDRFTGRTAELAWLDQLLTAGGPAASCVVSGSAGVGKTALAVHWGHRMRAAFPGGHLYADLRGYDPGEPVSPASVLAGFLRALGVADQDIPADTDQRSACFRSLMDWRRALLVLDNAASVEQVRPLLPGTPSCVVIVTSRDSLAGLVARHGARRLDLDLLPEADAVTLLRELIGARVDADRAAASTLAAQCARLPLALRVAAELATARPDLAIARLTEELSDEQRRLRLLDAGGDERTAVCPVLSWSYRRLEADAAQAFRQIGLHAGPAIDAPALAALTGTSAEHAESLLRTLAHGHLVYRAGPGRYAMHDLLRAYAAHVARAGAGPGCGPRTGPQAAPAPPARMGTGHCEEPESMYANVLLALARCESAPALRMPWRAGHREVPVIR